MKKWTWLLGFEFHFYCVWWRSVAVELSSFVWWILRYRPVAVSFSISPLPPSDILLTFGAHILLDCARAITLFEFDWWGPLQTRVQKNSALLSCRLSTLYFRYSVCSAYVFFCSSIVCTFCSRTLEEVYNAFYFQEYGLRSNICLRLRE
jgi:hypothetical protein